MIIIGELINASRKVIAKAIEENNKDVVSKTAKDQVEAGADYIDVNAGIFVDKEIEYIKWLVQIAQQETGMPCSIDSPNPLAIEAALSVHQGVPIINSISLEKDRYDKIISIIAGTDLKVIALCMRDEGMPQTLEERIRIADEIINRLTKDGIAVENIFVDPLVQPISVNNTYGTEFLNAIEYIMKVFPGVHTTCGLSNISYGLPSRKLLNRVFMVMAITKGLDTAIVNPLDKTIMSNIIAAETLRGNDEFCMNYLKAFRKGTLIVE